MERHTSIQRGERGPSLVSLRSLERGERSLSVAGSTRSPSVKAVEKGGLNTRDQHPLSTRLLACLAYAFMSVSITLFNKAVFSIYAFPFPAIITTLQIVVSLVYMLLLHQFRIMDLGISGVSLKVARQVLPLSAAWWLYVVSGVTALRYLNVPMYSVFRRTTTLLVVIGEWAMFNKSPTFWCGMSILIMVGGAVLAGATDLTYSLPGYIWVTICAISTAAYLLLIRKLSDRTGLKQSGLLFYNNLLALPMMLLYMIFATNELQDASKHHEQIKDPQFLIVLLFSASQAYLLNVCIFWCTTTNSALTTTVTGQMKDLATTGLGLVMFQDVKFNSKNITGVSIGMVGAMLYSFLSYWEKNNVRSQ